MQSLFVSCLDFWIINFLILFMPALRQPMGFVRTFLDILTVHVWCMNKSGLRTLWISLCIVDISLLCVPSYYLYCTPLLFVSWCYLCTLEIRSILQHIVTSCWLGVVLCINIRTWNKIAFRFVACCCSISYLLIYKTPLNFHEHANLLNCYVFFNYFVVIYSTMPYEYLSASKSLISTLISPTAL